MKGLIKNVIGTQGGLSPMLGVDCDDGTGYWIPRSEISRSQFWDATIIVVYDENNEYQGMSKVAVFDRDGVPESIIHLSGKRFKLDELELIDCRTKGKEK